MTRCAKVEATVLNASETIRAILGYGTPAGAGSSARVP
jgi:hypothetical protein